MGAMVDYDGSSGPAHCPGCGQFMGADHQCPREHGPRSVGFGVDAGLKSSGMGEERGGAGGRHSGEVMLAPVVSPVADRRVAAGLAVLRRQRAERLLAAPVSGKGPAGRCQWCGQFAGENHTCPVPEGMPAGQYGGLSGDARVKAMVADLESAVSAIVQSGQLRRWLDAMSSNGMSRWSLNNRLSAVVQMMQRGESVEGLHLMGFRQWEKFDRKVSKGAKAVWILAPVTRKVIREEDGREVEETRVVAFKGVPVFNISDTHGQPLPQAPVKPATGQVPEGMLEGLRERVARAGYAYSEEEIPGCDPHSGLGTQGYTQPEPKRVVVDARLSDAQKASVIAHELGHIHCGHVTGDAGEYRRHRGRMETEAEMTAYLVSRNRGLTREQTDAYSPGYIAGWSGGDAKVMHAALEKATRAFNTIIDGPWPATKGA